MIAILLTMIAYHVTPIAFPAWYGTSQFDPTLDPLQSDAPAALGANGSVAMTLGKPGGVQRIGVQRPDGTTTFLSLPSTVELREEIEIHEPPRFGQVVVADDGTPYASVASCFEAVGGGGCASAPFVWTGLWRRVPHPKDDQCTVAGAATFGTYVLQEDNSDTSAVDQSQGYPPPDAYFYLAGAQQKLPEFAALGFRARYIVGTESKGQPNLNGPVTTATPTPAPHALEYSDGKLQDLGIGVARAVDARGDAVGDDEPQPGATGRPTLWANGKVRQLSSAAGSADAISDTGLIAGIANGKPFVTDMNDPAHRIYAIDDVLGDRMWHVEREFGMARNGRMLVVARHAGGARNVVLLDPEPSTHR